MINKPLISIQDFCLLVILVIVGVLLLSKQASADQSNGPNLPLLQTKDTGPEIGQPGDIHLTLNRLIGIWDMDIKVWNNPSDDTPQQYRGTMIREWILRNRFVRESSIEISPKDIVLSEFRGRRPLLRAGTSYQGLGFLGFDRLAGVFEHVWMHDDSTRFYISKGRYKAASATLVLQGEWTDPFDGTIVTSRVELQFDQMDNHSYTRYITDLDTGEFKDLKITFTRKTQP